MYWAKICDTNKRILSKDVAKHFNYKYPFDADKNMIEFIKRVRQSPTDTVKIFKVKNGKSIIMSALTYIF